MRPRVMRKHEDLTQWTTTRRSAREKEWKREMLARGKDGEILRYPEAVLGSMGWGHADVRGSIEIARQTLLSSCRA